MVMDVLNFFDEYARMFKAIRKGVTITNIYIVAEGIMPGQEEISGVITATKDEIEKVIKWSKNNPKKTRLDDFKDKYPEVKIDEGFFGNVCCEYFGYIDKCKNYYDGDCCKDCWHEPVN